MDEEDLAELKERMLVSTTSEASKVPEVVPSLLEGMGLDDECV